MTLIQKNDLFRMYQSPGTDGDGYVEPDWRVWIREERWWQGGRGSWFYTGLIDVDRVYMVNLGEPTVEHLRHAFPSPA